MLQERAVPQERAERRSAIVPRSLKISAFARTSLRRRPAPELLRDIAERLEKTTSTRASRRVFPDNESPRNLELISVFGVLTRYPART